MKSRNPIALLMGWIALALAPADSATAGESGSAAPGTAAQFGSVSGRVTDGSTANPLQGAEVRIVGTAYETYTDARGIYRFPRVPAGNHQLRVGYLGIAPGTVSVTVSPGGTMERDVRLGAEVLMMDKFEVASMLEGQARAINRQRASDNITTVIASDDAGNLPDQTIEDLLSRVAGVSISGGGGVTIRGAAPELNSVMLDGERMSSSSDGNGGRGSHLSDVSGRAEGREVSTENVDADLIASVEVYRTLPAHMDADGIGGAVNVVTRSSLDLGRRIIRGRVDYTDHKIGDGGYGMALTYGDVVGADKRWGYILNLSHSNDDSASERNQPTYAFTPFDFPLVTSADLRYQTVDRTRYGVNGTIDHKLSGTTQLYVKGFLNFTRETLGVYRLSSVAFTSPNPATATPTFAESLPVTLGVNNAANRRLNGVNLNGADYERESDYYRVAFGGRTESNRFRLDYEVNFDHSAAGLDGIRANARTPIINTLVPTRFNRAVGWSVDRSETLYPIYDFTNPYDPGVDPITATDYRLVDLLEIYHTGKGDSFEQGYNGGVDLRIPNEIRGLPITFQTGLKYRGKYRTAGAKLQRLLVNDAAVRAAPVADRPMDGLFHEGGFTPPPMSDGRYPTIGTFVNTQAAYAFYQNILARQTPEQTAPTGTGIIRNQIQADILNWEARNYDAAEDIFAGYFMGTIDVRSLRLMPGVRVEHTRNKSKGRSFNQSLTRLERITSEGDYTDFFPSVVASYRLTQNHVIRAGITHTIARPNYVDMAPYQILPDDIGDPTEDVEIGNPNLKAQESRNLDLAYEWYFQPVGLFTVAGFQKDIERFIYQSINFDTVTVNLAEPGQPPDFAEVTRRRATQRNGADARLRGIELSWQHQLEFLPSPFDGFGFNVNYTYVQGRSRTPDDLTGELVTSDFLAKQAEEVYNAQLFYEKYRFRARVAMRHNSGWVQAIGNLGQTVIAPTSFWDASLQYALTKNFTLFAEGRNLTKEITIRYLRSIDTPTWQTQPWGYRFGARFNF